MLIERGGHHRWGPEDALVRALHDVTRFLPFVAAPPERDPDKEYPRRPRVPLPAAEPLEVTLGAALLARENGRRMDPDGPLALGRLAQLLRWTVGEVPAGAAGGRGRRMHPSGGGRYPLEVYVAGRRIDGLAAGLYHWHLVSGSLEVVSQASDRVERLWEALYFPWHRQSAALVLLTGQPARTMTKYGARGYRLMLLEAGAVLQNLGLVAAALGLHASPVGTPFDAQVEEVLQLDPDVELALAGFAVGVQASPDAVLSDERGTHARRSHDLDGRRLVDVAAPIFVVGPDRIAADPGTWASSERADRPSADGAAAVPEGSLVTSVSPDVAAIPIELWPASRTISGIRRAGHAIEWRRLVARPDEPHVYTYVVRLGTAQGRRGHPTRPSVALGLALGEAVARYVSRELVPAVTGEPVAPGATGVGAGQTRETAIARSLFDIVKDDALMLTWLAKRRSRRLDLERAPHGPLRVLVARIHDLGLEPHAVWLQTAAPLNVVGGAVHDPTGIGPAVALGTAANLSLPEAATAALTDAQLRWSAVRRWRDQGRTAPLEVTAATDHGRLMWWADGNRWKDLDWLFDTAPANWTEAARPADDGLVELLRWFDSQGLGWVVTDLTDAPLTRQLGHHVVRVTVPAFLALRATSPAHTLQGARLDAALAAEGRDAPNLCPHPFPYGP